MDTEIAQEQMKELLSETSGNYVQVRENYGHQRAFDTQSRYIEITCGITQFTGFSFQLQIGAFRSSH